MLHPMNATLWHRRFEAVRSAAPITAIRVARLEMRGGGWLLLATLILALAGARARFDLCLVKGDSMQPNLQPGDLLLVDKLAYRAAEPRRGDLVVARAGRDLLVKRVVGLPGEELELRLGELFVDRLAYAEFYPLEPGRLTLRPGRLLADRYALLGDNRDLPTSIHAVVSRQQIVGKVVQVWRLWPRWPTQDGDSTA